VSLLAQMPVGALQWLHLAWCILKVWLACAAFLVPFFYAARRAKNKL